MFQAIVASQIHPKAVRACFGRPITVTQPASATTYASMLATRAGRGATVSGSTCTAPTRPSSRVLVSRPTIHRVPLGAHRVTSRSGSHGGRCHGACRGRSGRPRHALLAQCVRRSCRRRSDLWDDVAVKTFDELFAELSGKAATRPGWLGHRRGAGRRRAHDRQEGRRGGGRGLDGRRARGSASGPPRRSPSCSTTCRCSCSPAASPSRTSTHICDGGVTVRRPLDRESRPCCASPCRTRARSPSPPPSMLREAGYRQRRDPRDLVLLDPRQRHRVLLPAAARHRDLRRLGRARRRHHRARPAARQRRAGGGDPAARLRAVDVPVRGAARVGDRPWPTSPASASPRRTPGCSAKYFADRGVDAEVIRLDGAVETAVRLGVADVIADVVSTGHHAAAGRARGRRGADPGVRGGAGAPGRDAGARRRSTSCVRRMQGVIVARRYVLVDYDIRAELVDEAVRAHPRHRVADGLAAARPRLGGGARDGAAGRHEPDHGRAVGDRCAAAILVTDIHACRL